MHLAFDLCCPQLRKPREWFISYFSYVNAEMFRTNANVVTTHAWSSKFYHWMFDWKSVLYYHTRDADNNIISVMLVGSIPVLWAVVAGVGVGAFSLLGFYLIEEAKHSVHKVCAHHNHCESVVEPLLTVESRTSDDRRHPNR